MYYQRFENDGVKNDSGNHWFFSLKTLNFESE